jgi:hypothetical protein
MASQYRQYYVMGNSGICKDRHVRDCAAAALDKLGSYKKLAQEACPLLRKKFHLRDTYAVRDERSQYVDEDSSQKSVIVKAIDDLHRFIGKPVRSCIWTLLR